MANYIKKDSGFTLVELLITCFVVSSGIVASYLVIQDIFVDTFTVSSRLTAAYLAEEGIEIVRNIRDSNWVAGDFWATNLYRNQPSEFLGCDQTLMSPGKYCEADYSQIIMTDIDDENPPTPLRLNGIYNYSAGTNTKFSRKIEIIPDSISSASLTRLIVKSEIIWQENGQTKSITAETNLHNWR